MVIGPDQIKIRTAQLPAGSNEDRLVVTASSFAVIDGATSHYKVPGPTGGDYADQLAAALGSELRSTTTESLKTILGRAIDRTITSLDLVPNSSAAPSCTVAIVRIVESELVEALVLGDSTVAFGFRDGSEEFLTDDRLGDLDLPASRDYRDRLRRGSGYDETHRALLSSLQQDQARYRNREGGYWIASTDPSAAEHAIVVARPIEHLRWVVSATDGAADAFDPVGIAWETVAAADSERLSELLVQCHVWEQCVDPTGSIRPRSKQHDDKTVAAFMIA